MSAAWLERDWLRGEDMPQKRSRVVNLDALIERADFEADADTSQSNQVAINIQHLERENSFFLRSLRKPDFQRETASWEPEQVRDFIRTFIEGDFYPAILLWLSKRGAFVIDGAHRLSALIAWVEDDYGDRKTSRDFFGPNISEDQLRYAEETRQLVEKKFGKYKDYFSILHPAPNSRPIDAVLEKRAVAFGQRAIATQQIPGDAQKAEKSFFKINRSATLIDKIELDILKARRRPTGIAARAMLRAGSGYKYWRAFDHETRAQIERQAEEIYMQLWTPILTVPIRTPNLPVAGSNYSTYTLALLFQFISLANEQPSDAKKKRQRRPAADDMEDIEAEDPEADKDGAATLNHLRNVRWIADRISSNSEQGSLGLHPAVYFYSSEGRFQPTAFLAIVRLVQQLDRENGFIQFTKVRRAFEDVLIKYKFFSNQVTAKWGSGIKAYERYYDLLRFILAELAAQETDRVTLSQGTEECILEDIKQHETFKFLNTQEPPNLEEEIGKDFSKATRSRAFLEQAVFAAGVFCPICKGYIDTHKSHNMDHKLPKRDDGRGHLANAQITHFYCNTGFKEWLDSQNRKS